MAKLTINEAAAGFTHKVAFDYVDLQRTGFLSTIGAANQFKAGKLGAGGIIDTAVLYQVVDPAGATDLTIDFGVTGTDPDELIDNGDVDALTKIIWNTGDAFVGTDSGSPAETTSNVVNGYANNTASAVDLIVELNGTVANLTAGSWVLAWRQMEVPTS
jgi:hypothetical protein